jgi:hypothetical protein
MRTSTSISAIAKALAAVSADLRNPAMDATNPGFKSKFISLVGLIDSLRGPLHAHGIVVLQPVSSPVAGRVRVTTTLLHSSGEWMSSTADLASGATAQSFGTAVSYLRRYTLQAMLGVSGDADADDDGEAERLAALKPLIKRKAEPVPTLTLTTLTSPPVVKKSSTTAATTAPVNRVDFDSTSTTSTGADVFVVLKVNTGATKSGTSCAQVFLGIPDVPDEICAYCWHKNLTAKLATRIGQRVRLVIVQKQREGKTIDLIEEMFE